MNRSIDSTLGYYLFIDILYRIFLIRNYIITNFIIRHTEIIVALNLQNILSLFSAALKICPSRVSTLPSPLRETKVFKFTTWDSHFIEFGCLFYIFVRQKFSFQSFGEKCEAPCHHFKIKRLNMCLDLWRHKTVLMVNRDVKKLEIPHDVHWSIFFYYIF